MVVGKKDAESVLRILRDANEDASIIGELVPAEDEPVTTLINIRDTKKC